VPKAPAFPFYARDWVSDGKVSRLSPAAQGVYVRLLCHQWLEGSLPFETDFIATTAGLQKRSMRVWWRELEEFFPVVTGTNTRANPRLEEIRNELTEHALAKSTAGKAGAKARWQAHDSANAKPVTEGMASAMPTQWPASASASTTPPPASDAPARDDEPPPDWHQEPFGNKVNDLWRKHELQTARGYDWLQGAVVVSSLTKDWEEAEILAVITKIATTPALAWAGTKGPAYLAVPCGKARISVMETCHRWRDDPQKTDEAAPKGVYKFDPGDAAKYCESMKPDQSTQPQHIGDLLEEGTP